MLQDLKVLNGEISLKFDPYQTHYSVMVSSDVSSLTFDYVVADGVFVEILGNDLDVSTEVEFKVTKNDKTSSYFFHIVKEEEKVSSSNPTFLDLEVNLKKEISPYAVPGISSICFLLILFLFVFLFHKRKKAKK